MVRPVADLYARVRHHGPELVKFGIVGGIGTIVDLGGAAVLHSAYHMGPLESKAISLTAATILTYLGSRFWTFRHRENQPVHREAMLFIVLNAVGLVVAEVVIAGVTYGLDLKDPLAYNAASIVGTGLGTIFRWYAYRKWVFLAPAQQPSPRYAPAADYPHYTPWEPHPAYRTPAYSAYPDRAYSSYAGPAYPAYQDRGYPDPAYAAYPAARTRQERLEDPFIPNGPVASPMFTAPVPAGHAAGPVRPVRPVRPVGQAPAPAPVPVTHRAPGRHRRTR